MAVSAISGVSSGAYVQQVNNAAAERRVEQARLAEQDQARREADVARTDQQNVARRQAQQASDAEAAQQRDFLTRQQLQAQNSQPQAPAPGSRVNEVV
ncbi:hypothetical protein [Massilia sp. NR 4-1]|uniref:hypothetical protein n=1 Tax=Massilia sp. NR 4-1 TaxID=1678028 RepID=UPI000B12D983|nr:hypothetical protein [Massilia sp. NR 4-1]